MPTATCPKCDGSRNIQAFGHIASGVCFCCRGTGKIRVKTELRRTLSEAAGRKADWIMSATTSSYERLTMAQLDSAREFCHSHVPGYPGLYAAWMSQGESVFQERQAVEHRKFVAAMAW